MTAETRPVPTSARDLAALAELTAELAATVQAPGVVVRVLDQGTRAEAGLNHGVPTVTVGADLLGSPALDAILAHEIAHLALSHGQTPIPRWLVGLSAALRLTAVGVVLAVLAGLAGWWLCLVAAGAFALAVTADLARAYLARCREYEADAYAVQLLDQAGRDGRAALRAALRLEEAHETPWGARVGWLRSDHPPAAARLRRLLDDLDRTFPNDQTPGGTA